MAAGGRGLGAALLAQHVVGQLAAPVLLHGAGAQRRQVHQCVARKLAHARLGHVEHPGKLVVALAAPEHELHDGALVLGKLIEGRHGSRTIGCAA